MISDILQNTGFIRIGSSLAHTSRKHIFKLRNFKYRRNSRTCSRASFNSLVLWIFCNFPIVSIAFPILNSPTTRGGASFPFCNLYPICNYVKLKNTSSLTFVLYRFVIIYTSYYVIMYTQFIFVIITHVAATIERSVSIFS